MTEAVDMSDAQYKPAIHCEFTMAPPLSRPLRSGQWRRWRDGDINRAAVGCPDCGLVLLLAVHTVDGDGNVSPSIGCTSCGHHSWGKLAGWVREPVQRAEGGVNDTNDLSTASHP